MLIDLAKILFDDGEPDEATVQSYVEKIQRDEPLKAAVLCQLPDGRYGIVDGRCRLEAARRCGEPSFDAYVVEVNGQQVGELRRNLNEDHRLTN